MSKYIELLLALIIGTCIGSFLNVVAYRLPRNESIAYPGSHCIYCDSTLIWYEKIPIFSWLILKAKCSYCAKKIPFRYFFIEILCGLLFLLNQFFLINKGFFITEHVLNSIFGSVFISIMILLVLFDMDYLWLPEKLCLFGIIIALIYTFLNSLDQSFSYAFFQTLMHFIFSVIGFILFRFLSFISFKILNKPSLGLGDANLSALIASWLGLYGLFISVWISSYFGGLYIIIGLIAKKIRPGQKIPLAPFLASGALMVWFLGEKSIINLLTHSNIFMI